MALSKYKAQVLLDYKEDRLVLVNSVLEESFFSKEHADKKVALISIQGTSRLGKSQLMQLLALHLLLNKNVPMGELYPCLDSFGIIGSDEEEVDEDGGTAQKQSSKKSALQRLKNKMVSSSTKQHQQKATTPDVVGSGHSSATGDANKANQQKHQQLQELFFKWKRGIDGHTRGIWISGPYMLTDADGDEVACFLMDSQGSNDRTNTWCLISVFNQLITSTLIQNMHKDIDDTATEFFNIFREMAEFVMNQQMGGGEFEQPDEEPKPENVRKMFQQLLLLIRDWQNPDVFDFGLSGGQGLLDKFVEDMSLDGSKKVVCDQLLGSFDAVNACLMPHPGKYLLGLKNPEELCLDKISPTFMEVVEELAESLCSPANLVLKRDENGQPMTCKQLGNRIKAYYSLLKDTKASAINPTQMRASMELMKLISQVKDEHLDGLSSVDSVELLESKHKQLLASAAMKMQKTLKKLGVGTQCQQEEVAKLKNGLQKMFESMKKQQIVFSGKHLQQNISSAADECKKAEVRKEANTAFWQGYAGYLFSGALLGGSLGTGGAYLLVLGAIITAPVLPAAAVGGLLGVISGATGGYLCKGNWSHRGKDGQENV